MFAPGSGVAGRWGANTAVGGRAIKADDDDSDRSGDEGCDRGDGRKNAHKAGASPDVARVPAGHRLWAYLSQTHGFD